MDLGIQDIENLKQRLLNLRSRAEQAIANSQNQNDFPYVTLNHAQRIFAAVLAAQVRDTAQAACKHLGLELNTTPAAEQMEKIATFFSQSASWIGTTPSAMESGRISAVEALIDWATQLIGRAERVLEKDETMSGQRLIHSELWEK